MLNVFPDLLAFGLLAPLLLRLALGLAFLDFGWNKLRRHRAEKAALFESFGLKPGIRYAVAVGALELAVGIFLVIGFLTQIAALAALAICGAALYLKVRHRALWPHDCRLFILLAAISFSLLFSGAGFFAFDLPL